MRCTMQVWTTAWGNTEVIASGKPLSPSTTAIRMSWVPRLRSSVITRSQKFRAFGLLDPQPEDFFVARATHPKRQVNRPVVDHAFVADLYADRVEEHDGVGCFQPAALPSGGLLEHRIGYRAHQVW